MRLVRFAALAACLFAMSSSIAAPLSDSTGSTFQPRATGQLDAYQDDSKKEKCPLTDNCVINFHAITGSRVLILHVSCSFAMGTGNVPIVAGLNIGGQTASNLVPVIKGGDVSGGAYYIINAQTYLFVDKGAVPAVAVLSSSKQAKEFHCTVSGYHA
jgi:hypothetical protein